jgi:hypothetical protein
MQEENLAKHQHAGSLNESQSVDPHLTIALDGRFVGNHGISLSFSAHLSNHKVDMLNIFFNFHEVVNRKMLQRTYALMIFSFL